MFWRGRQKQHAGRVRSPDLDAMRARSSLCAVAERDHRVGPGGAQGGNVTGQERDRAKRESDDEERRRIKRADVVKQAAQRATAQNTKKKTDAGTEQNQLRGA